MGARTIAWGLCTPLTIVDQFGIKISGFTPSFEALGHLLKKKKKVHTPPPAYIQLPEIYLQ